METAIQDHGGTLFEVQFRMCADGVPEVASLRVLNDQYSAVGPNLAEFMASMMVMVAPNVVTNFLSLVSEQIHDSRGIGAGSEAV